MDIGTRLRELREKSGLNGKEVVEKLSADYDTVITTKSLYSYETNARMLNAKTFVALLEIYNCKDFFGEFKDVKVDYSIPTDEDAKLLERYHSLDLFGQDMVDTVLKKEAARCEAQKELQRQYEIVNEVKKALGADSTEKRESANESQTSKTG